MRPAPPDRLLVGPDSLPDEDLQAHEGGLCGDGLSRLARAGALAPSGTPVVYAADTPATALLETLVYADRADLIHLRYVVFEISLDPVRHLLRLPANLLPSNWKAWPWPASTQEVGTYWFESQASVVLEVPCVVVPYQRNYLINPGHALFGELAIEGPVEFPIDPRLARQESG